MRPRPWVGKKSFLGKESFPPKEEDEYYVYELLGLRVELLEGDFLGEVVGLMPVGPYELLEVRSPAGKTFYLPMIEEVIREIDLEKRKIVVTPPEGLLEAQEITKA